MKNTYQKFWIVCRVKPCYSEYTKHWSEEAAIDQAKQLAEANIGIPFTVMESGRSFTAKAEISEQTAVKINRSAVQSDLAPSWEPGARL
jgi:hypothetical protein